MKSQKYEELVKRLHKRIALTTAGSPLQDDLQDAADAIEELKDLVARAIGFWDSAETVNAMRSLNSYMPDITDPEWQKAHMEMGFYSPIGEVYKEMGVYDEPPKEE